MPLLQYPPLLSGQITVNRSWLVARDRSSLTVPAALRTDTR